MTKAQDTLAGYLRDRRLRLDPAAFGFTGSRRRTTGLRREEVAQRANISPTWYTWLEQGRGGAPSADVLNRIAAGLMLTEPERQHLFMLGLGHPPEARYRPVEGISPRLQRLLDAMDTTPAIVRTATWDVVAWNAAACVVMTDYAALPPSERNILRLVFCNPRVRAAQQDFAGIARFVVAAFRADAARAGANAEITDLVAELSAKSPDFARLWTAHDVTQHGEGTKRLNHAILGPIELEYSGFSVDGRPDLGLVVYNPVQAQDADRIRALVKARKG
ncbi:helix-turn-helix transcriptional regulator [Rhizobium sp. SSA_523]|uniref:helix-turn-helix transcriptional regulator n=1 Tax=Rhizobium sp. SSA_523 TaxID=2952477 RepID=UPI002090DA5C|nr:helix-turn-helix transcriptional regulator [Rhizobium sp. SSA_523]MCO5733147.1 helix-turn-helix transcriptional regulator [Rhizobium sp. SSA_523]WKC24020.1 helix-turn-helix transcriptional regulator [Rhizobium sp. SSA_523]